MLKMHQDDRGIQLVGIWTYKRLKLYKYTCRENMSVLTKNEN